MGETMTTTRHRCRLSADVEKSRNSGKSAGGDGMNLISHVAFSHLSYC